MRRAQAFPKFANDDGSGIRFIPQRPSSYPTHGSDQRRVPIDEAILADDVLAKHTVEGGQFGFSHVGDGDPVFECQPID